MNPGSKFSHLSDQELLDILKDWSTRHDGKIPTSQAFNASDLLPPVSIYQRRFGSWAKATQKAGFIRKGKFNFTQSTRYHVWTN